MVYIPIHTWVQRDDLIQQASQVYKIPLTELRVHDSIGTNLPAVAASNDLAIIGGTYGSAMPVLQSSDGKNTTVAEYARFQFALPPEYDTGESITVRLNAGAITTVSSTTMTVDVVCHKNGAGADICTTAAVDANDLEAADADFTITPTGMVAGDILDIRIAVAIDDTATQTAVICQINSVSILLDVKC